MEQGSRALEAMLGAIVLGVVALFVWLSLAVGGGAPSDAKRYVLLFDSALGLTVDNAVAIAGVKIGVVDDIGIEGRNAKVTIAIDKDVKVYEDAKGAVRAKTLLGEKYLDLDPGQAPARLLEPGTVLAQNTPTVEIDQLIRQAARLVDSLNVIAPPLETAMARFDELLKSADGEDVGRELGRAVADLGVLLRETSALVSTSGEDLRVLLKVSRERAPEVLARVSSAADKVDKILAAIDPERIAKITEKIDPAVADIETTLTDLKLAMADVRDASARLDGIMLKVDRTLDRSESINERTIREFLQVEGVRVNLIPDSRVERRLKRLRNEATPLPVP
jgi:phospholipid/cholesterol/gamma-HCH transport system substrate-binding protein